MPHCAARRYHLAQLTFEQVLEKIKAATSDSMKYLRLASEMALEHFAEHGNLVYCQQLFDLLSENNYVKRSRMSFVRWLAKYAPIKVEQNHPTKDRDREEEIDLDGARKEPFWDLAPPKEIVNYTKDDVVTSLKRAIAPFRGDRKTANDDEALAALTIAEQAVAEVARKIAAQPEQKADKNGR